VSRPLTLLLSVSVLAATLLPLAATVVTGLLVGSIPPAVRDGLDSAAGRYTLSLLAGASLLIVAERLLTPFQGALASAFGRRVDRHLQERTMAAVGGPTGISHLESPAVLDLIETARGVGVHGLRPGDATAALANLLPSWLAALGSAAILTTFRWWLGLAWLIMWPVVLYYLQREYLRVGEVGYGQTAALRRADYYRDLALRPSAAKEVRVWMLPSWLEGRFETAWRCAMEPVWRARRPGRAVVWLPTVAVVAANIGTFGLLAWAAVRGNLSLGALAVYAQATLGANQFRAFDDANMILSQAAVSVPKVLDLERRLAERPVERTRSLSSHGSHHAIRFEGVGFRYPGSEHAVLSALDLEIPAGRSLALVGANGAGKTTLVKLLCRLYEPTSGRISMNGVDVTDVDPREWRRGIAAIFQDFNRYHLTARDNIAMGALALADDVERLREAARRAGALELIESLPRGWDTVLSREYTGGVDLSGGQWQRIALARALFAVEGGANVLVLDEPTANLDVRAEAELYDRFLEITEGLTTILISHRFSTVRRADQIIVLEGGRVVEAGHHDDLVAEGGRYARMFQLQAKRFARATEGRV
jgi:ABC-type multidrug transport system fused ATPase/permease subunit